MIAILAVFAACFLIQTTNCTAYHPGNYPSYDVLSPSDIVQENPIAYVDIKDGKIANVSWTNISVEDGNYIVVNDAFWQWAYDLKREIQRLR